MGGRKRKSRGGKASSVEELKRIWNESAMQPIGSSEAHPPLGTLVFAKGYGQSYWPGFLSEIPLPHEIDVDDEDGSGGTHKEMSNGPFPYALIIYLEDNFRLDYVFWDKIIPASPDGSTFEDQVLMVESLNKLEHKRWHASLPAFRKSLAILRSFVTIPLEKREEESKSRRQAKKDVDKERRQAGIREGKSRRKVLQEANPTVPGPSSSASTTEFTFAIPLAPASTTRPWQGNIDGFEDSTLNSSYVPPGRTRSSIGIHAGLVDQATIGLPSEEWEEEELAKIGRKSAIKDPRPKEGEALKDWVMERFDSINKRLQFGGKADHSCSSCREDIPSEDVKYCHEFPFHEECLVGCTETVDGKDESVFKCTDCLSKSCFICKKGASDGDNPTNLTKCSKCVLWFHRICLKKWPQAEVIGSYGSITCPLHFCHVCKVENSLLNKVRDYTVTPSNSYRCVYCLAAYHKGTCVPAGVGETIMGNQFLICPRHYGKECQTEEEKKQKKVLGCFTCKKVLKRSEEMLECKSCPLMFHIECGGYGEEERNQGVHVSDFRQDFRCEGCTWGLYPLHGEVVWYKQPGSVYWPALVDFPKSLPVGETLKPGLSSVTYCGTRGQSYRHAKTFKSLSFCVSSLDMFTKLGLYNQTKPAIVTAYEEGKYLSEVAEEYRESIIPKAKPIYKKLTTNYYGTGYTAKAKKETGRKEELEQCSCGSSKENKDKPLVCTQNSDCVNRLLCIECTDKNCTGKERCENRMFSSKTGGLESRLEYFVPPGGKGWGVRAKANITTGSFILEYRGEIISKQEMAYRKSQKMAGDPLYFLEIDANTIIDAEYYGNLSRLINHSCDPNCDSQIYTSAKNRRVAGIFAQRDIKEGEEITFNYNYGKVGAISLRCHCESANCKGAIGNIKNLDSDVTSGPSKKKKKRGVEDWDDFCTICRKDGEVLMCDFEGCRKAFHLKCVGKTNVPDEIWICPYHENAPKLVTKSRRASQTRVRRVKKSKKEKSKNPTVSKTSIQEQTSLASTSRTALVAASEIDNHSTSFVSNGETPELNLSTPELTSADGKYTTTTNSGRRVKRGLLKLDFVLPVKKRRGENTPSAEVSTSQVDSATASPIVENTSSVEPNKTKRRRVFKTDKPQTPKATLKDPSKASGNGRGGESSAKPLGHTIENNPPFQVRRSVRLSKPMKILSNNSGDEIDTSVEEDDDVQTEGPEVSYSKLPRPRIFSRELVNSELSINFS